jgi:threonyl-tRNA synthetase
MAQAVTELFPGTRLCIGPPVEDGFYYDFEAKKPFTPEDLEKIEARMKEIIKGNFTFEQTVHSKEEALEVFSKRDEKFKVEMIKELPGDTVTFVQHDTFVDLCRGLHAMRTGNLKHFKLLKVAGAYWRGDEKREQLQRIYGTAWPTKDELDAYLTRLEEAKKRDHRELGPRLDLFSIEPDHIGSGLILWHPKGARIRIQIEEYLRNMHLARGYQPVYTPHIGRAELWKTSGHVDFYRDNMFSPMDVEGQAYYVKPMNCPFHIAIYNAGLHSYRELPIKLTELGTVYRYERSGVLHGLMRVRGFTQDDSHIFCRPDQLQTQITEVLQLAKEILTDFGFKEYDLKLSTRPEKYVGSLEDWQRAETALEAGLKASGLPYEIDPGEGVFYGPKIDLKIKDSIGRPWQCSTIQVDFNNPERFGMTYRDDSGHDVRPIMVHRAILGSIERFFGILIEHYAGAFPAWLAPVQVVILPISEKVADYSEQIYKELVAAGFRVELDSSNQTIGGKIREATMQKIPYMLVVGEKEKAAQTVALRNRTGENLGTPTLPEFIARLKDDVKARR